MRMAVTMGDPAGVGPEIIVKALKQIEYLNETIVYGSAEVLQYYSDLLKADLKIRIIEQAEEAQDDHLNVIEPRQLSLKDFEIGKLSAACGDMAFQCLKRAVEDAVAGKVSAIVTAPLNKEAMNLAGHHYDGHTGAIMHLLNDDHCRMVLWSDKLKVIHVTTHVALRKACDLCTRERVEETIRIAAELLKRSGNAHPHIAVAGLNPHAGENGLFGDEEIREIIPAIEQCCAEGLQVSGPLPPDTAFLRASQGEFDMVVAMYHDQGHIPLKMLDFGSGVNISAGLKILRTSVDHGTAFDIAGKGIASEESMISALEAAEKLL